MCDSVFIVGLQQFQWLLAFEQKRGMNPISAEIEWHNTKLEYYYLLISDFKRPSSVTVSLWGAQSWILPDVTLRKSSMARATHSNVKVRAHREWQRAGDNLELRWEILSCIIIRLWTKVKFNTCWKSTANNTIC